MEVTTVPARGQAAADPAGTGVRAELMAGLPVVNAVLGRLGLDAILSGYLPDPDPRCGIEPARVIGVLVRNLALGRQPLYGLGAWAALYDPALLGLRPAEAALLNDDRAGRALDELYLADRASMTTRLSLAAISAYGICAGELHNDSTSLALYGAYRDRASTGPDSGPARPPRPARGHSKDHRPDLKQLVWILTVSADGAVPLTCRLADGNTEDSTTRIATWQACRVIAGRADFLYVADSKLAATANMAHIAAEGGRFLTIMPRTRTEDTTGRDWLADNRQAGWAQIARRPGPRKLSPPVIYQAVPAPWPSKEGYRIVWIRSSAGRLTAAARTDAITRATAALAGLAGRLDAPRCWLKTPAAVEHAAAAAIARASAARWVGFHVTEQTITEHRQAGPGRPGPNTRYRSIDRRRRALTFTVDDARAARDAASDGCYPLITNDTQMTPAELFAAYKRQPRLERRHATFKGILHAAPAELKNDTRIDALSFCLYTALLIHALIERQLRNAMASQGITSLPLYHEDRPCTTPSAARVLQILSPLARTIIRHHDQALTVIPPSHSPLQDQILTMLGMPPSTYHDNAKTTDRNSP
jgi:hypothetical protein